ncbi:MAG: hypothetical protein FD138_464 [Planctomycetota bacterium]|nr:MAG: hypothetical protein FD138_464 [Planctomycetota bacterium]
MSLLLDLQDKLRDTGALIAQHEKAMATSQSPSVAASLRSLQKRNRRLEAEFTEAAESAGVDVCSYRLFADNEKKTLSAVSIFSAVEAFQNAFSVMFDAIRKGPKSKAALTPEIKQETEFQFGYAFSGSVGLVLTMTNKQFLVETALDQTMEAMVDMARSASTEDVLQKSRSLGAAVVKAMHGWARNHVNSGLGVDMKWIRGPIQKTRLILELSQLKALTESLAEATEDVTDTIKVIGRLVGFETESQRRFHFRSASGDDIKGSYSALAISDQNPATAPADYEATFDRKFKKVMATDEEIAPIYYLVKLTPLH